MKIFITTLVDKIWPVHRVEVQTDAGVVVATGESRATTSGTNGATVQEAAANLIYNMEHQLEQVKEHLRLNGLLKKR